MKGDAFSYIYLLDFAHIYKYIPIRTPEFLIFQKIYIYPYTSFFLPKFTYPQKISRLRRDFKLIMYYMVYLEPPIVLLPPEAKFLAILKCILSDFTVKNNHFQRTYQLKSSKFSPAALRNGSSKYIYTHTDPRIFEIFRKYIYTHIYIYTHFSL